jgi:hypothetical protein
MANITKTYIQTNFPDWSKYLNFPVLIFNVTGITLEPAIEHLFSNNGNIFQIVALDLSDGAGKITVRKIEGNTDPKASGNLVKESGAGDATISFTSYDKSTFSDASQIDACITEAQNEIAASITIDWDSDYPKIADDFLLKLTKYNIVAREKSFDKLSANMPINADAINARKTLEAYRKGELTFGTPTPASQRTSPIYMTSKPPFSEQ